MPKPKLKAPFPYPGGKTLIADVIWERLGDVRTYIEPFAGSAATLLSRPDTHVNTRYEIINDKDGLVTNFWRAVKHAPEKIVPDFADLRSENNYHARRKRLRSIRPELAEKLEADPDYYDPQIAAWFAYVLNLAIGSQIGGRRSIPAFAGGGASKRRTPDETLHTLNALAGRLRNVMVASGNWDRVVTDVFIQNAPPTGILFDPPYAAGNNTRNDTYGEYDTTVAGQVRRWCLDHGNDPTLRIALCGYAGEGHEELEHHGWSVHAWSANGGFANSGQRGGDNNRHRERIWFSPHCLKHEGTLFEELTK